MVFPVSTSPLNIASMPSRSSASANFLSVLTRACTSSLKGFVFVMTPLLSARPALLAPLIVEPVVLGCANVPLLPLLRPTGQQDHDRVTISPKVNSIARPEVEPVFQNTLADALHIGEVALLQAGYCAPNLGTRDRIQFREPIREGLAIVRSNIVTDFEHRRNEGNISVTFESMDIWGRLVF